MIPSDLQAARELALWLLGKVNEMGYDEASAFGIRLALEEALANAVKYGGPTETVDVEYDVDDARARFTITDQGAGFDPADIPDPCADENLEKPSGRGIMLMRAYMDEVAYSQGGRRVTMTKSKC